MIETAKRRPHRLKQVLGAAFFSIYCTQSPLSGGREPVPDAASGGRKAVVPARPAPVPRGRAEPGPAVRTIGSSWCSPFSLVFVENRRGVFPMYMVANSAAGCGNFITERRRICDRVYTIPVEFEQNMSTLRKIRENPVTGFCGTAQPVPARRTAPPRPVPRAARSAFPSSGQASSAPAPAQRAALRPAVQSRRAPPPVRSPVRPPAYRPEYPQSGCTLHSAVPPLHPPPQNSVPRPAPSVPD